MNRRGFFIVSGTSLLVVGLAGLALLQTGSFDGIIGPGIETRLETPSRETPPQVSDQAGQSTARGKIPVPSDQGVAPAPREGAQVEKPGTTPPLIPPVLKGERRYPGQKDLAERPKTGPGLSAKSTAPGAEAAIGRRQDMRDARRPLTIRLVYDPSRNRDLKIARVRMGDRVVIKVRRQGPAERQIYLGFDLPERTEKRSYPYHGRAVKKTGTVITPVRDSDQFTLRDGRQFGAALSRRLESREGAVMKLGAKPLRAEMARTGSYRRESGRYEVEVRIYSGNRWDIKPRSLL